jgi:predicted Zn-dependent protease
MSNDQPFSPDPFDEPIEAELVGPLAPHETMPRQSENRIQLFLIGGTVAICLVVGLAIFAVVVYQRSVRHRPPTETAEEKYRETAAAFDGDLEIDDKRRFREVTRHFVLLQKALDQRNGTLYQSLYDFDRMADELMHSSSVPGFAKNRRAFIDGMRQGAGNVDAMAAIYSYDSFDIKRIKTLADDECVVFVRLVANDTTSWKMRWWLKRKSGAWRFYDYEELDTALRASQMMDIMLQSLISDPANRNSDAKHARVQQQVKQLQAAGIALAEEEIETAERVLADIDVSLLPKPFQAVRWVHQANLDLYNENYEAVLSACDRIESLQDDVPLVLFLRAAAHNGLGQHEQAIVLIQKYLELLGADVHAYLQLGTALAGLDRKPEALDAYRNGLDEDANSVDTLYNLGLLLAADEVDEVGRRFMQTARPAENFEALAQAFFADEAVEALEAVVRAYAATARNDPNTGYYQAQVHVMRGEFDAAAAAIEAALPLVKDSEELEYYVVVLADSLYEVDRTTEAYEKSPDKKYAFEHIADRFVSDERWSDLDVLIEVHKAAHPEDPLLMYYAAEILVARDQFEEAAETVKSAFDRVAGSEDAQFFHRLYLDSLARVNKHLAAYDGVPDKRPAFDYLAGSLLRDDEDEDRARLKKFVDHHAATDPEDPKLAYYRAEILREEGKPLEAAKLIESVMPRIEDESEREYFVSSYLKSMVMAGRAMEAYRAAEDAEVTFDDLAELLLDLERYDDLQELVAGHRAVNPQSEWLDYYLGAAAANQEKWDEAADAYRRGLNHAADDDMRSNYRWYLVGTMHSAGRWQAAYAELEPKQDVFNQLTGLLSADKDANGLATLVRMHGKQVADDKSLLFWAAEVDWLRGDYASVAEKLSENRDVLLQTDSVSYRIDPRLISSLIHLQRFDDALEIAGRVDGNAWYLAQIHAARGSVTETAANLSRLIKEGYRAVDFYDDEILGRALRSEAFRGLRQKFPPPAEPEAESGL